MEQQKITNEQIESMAKEIIEFLKQNELWETDCGLIYNGKHVTHNKTESRNEELAGVMRIWYEGPLAYAVDMDAKIFGGLDKIMNKYGCYASPYSYCDMNVYLI